MSDPPPKTSEVLTGSSMQIKIPNGNIWAKKLGKESGQNEILSETRYYTVDPMLFLSGNPFKCHEEIFVFAAFDPTQTL